MAFYASKRPRFCLIVCSDIFLPTEQDLELNHLSALYKLLFMSVPE